MSKQFVRNIGTVLSGTLAAQFIPIAGTLVLARIFSPGSFGIYSAWLGLVMFLAVVLTCRFEMALAVEADGNPRKRAAYSTIATICITSSGAFAMLAGASWLDLEFLGKFSGGLLLLLVPTAAVLAATQTYQNWAAADGRYTQLSLMRIAQAGAIVVLQICFGLLASKPFELACGYFAGALIGLLSGVLLTLREGDAPPSLHESLSGFWRRQRQFPMFSLPADAVSAATAQLPVVVVASRFGPEAAGLLAMAMRMVGAPMSMLSASVLDVFKRHAAQAFRERQECRKQYLYSFWLLCIVSVVSTIFIFFLAEPFFRAFFGESWAGAGAIALLLLPRFALGFVASPLSYIVYIVGKQHIDLFWQLSLLAMTLASLLLADSFHAALLIYAAGYGFLYILYIWMSYSFSLGERR